MKMPEVNNKKFQIEEKQWEEEELFFKNLLQHNDSSRSHSSRPTWNFS